MKYNLNFDYAASILGMILLAIYYIRPKLYDMSARIFQILVACVLFACASEIISTTVNGHLIELPIVIRKIISVTYLTSLNACALIHYRYVIELTKNRKNLLFLKGVFRVGVVLLGLIAGILFFTNWIIYFDKMGAYQHGKLFVLLFLYAGFFVLNSALFMVRIRKNLNTLQKVSVLFFACSMISAFLMIYVFGMDNLLIFFTVLYLFLIYVSLQNPEYYVDSEIGCYNKEAFLKVCEEKLASSQKFTVLSFTANGTDYVNQVFGMDAGLELQKSIAEYYISNFHFSRLFHIEGNHFVYITSHSLKYIEAAYEKTWDFFHEPYPFRNTTISLHPRGAAILIPSVAETAKDILAAVFFSKNKELNNEGRDLFYLSSEYMKAKIRKEHVVHVLKEKIRKKDFELRFMPVFSNETKMLVGVEVLGRARDDEGHLIYPEEYISIAEEMGVIHEIDQIIFEKVCSLLAKLNKSKHSFQTVQINLSSIDMPKSDLSKYVEFIDFFQIPPGIINFEVKESACIESRKELIHNMRILREKGCTFSIDNYGSGFSNMVELMNMRFDMVKIDRSILHEAAIRKEARCVYESIVEMSKNMGYIVQATGIETRNEMHLIESMEVDYVQGFMISEPLTYEELMKVF